jgi:hypothetical protein
MRQVDEFPLRKAKVVLVYIQRPGLGQHTTRVLVGE